jgi:hypothetical protein
VLTGEFDNHTIKICSLVECVFSHTGNMRTYVCCVQAEISQLQQRMQRAQEECEQVRQGSKEVSLPLTYHVHTLT